MLSDRRKHPDLTILTRKQIQLFVEYAPPSLKTTRTATHDLINWHLPKLAISQCMSTCVSIHSHFN